MSNVVAAAAAAVVVAVAIAIAVGWLAGWLDFSSCTKTHVAMSADCNRYVLYCTTAMQYACSDTDAGADADAATVMRFAFFNVRSLRPVMI